MGIALRELFMVRLIDCKDIKGNPMESYLMLTQMMTEKLMPICSSTKRECTHLTEEEAIYFMAHTTSNDRSYKLEASEGKVRRTNVSLLRDRMNGGNGERK